MATGQKGGWGRRWLVVLVLVALIVAGGTVLILPRLRGRDKLFYNRGMLLLDQGDTTAALDSFHEALRRNPQMQAAQIGVARALIARHEFDAAQEAVDKAVQMGYSQAEAAMLHADVLALRAAYRLDSAGDNTDLDLCSTVISQDVEPAIALVQQYADATRQPARAYDRLGDLFMRESRVYSVEWDLLRKLRSRAASLKRTDEVAERDRQRAEALSNMAQSQGKAIDAYKQSMSLDPKLVSPRLAVAEQATTSYVPQPELARRALGPVLAQTPDNRRARLLLADVERIEGHFDKALENVAAARSRQDEDFGLMRAKALILDDAKRWKELLPLSARLVQLNPTDRSAAYLRGHALLNAPEPDPDKRKDLLKEAVSSLQTIFRRPGGWPMARLLLAQALSGLGSQEQARSAYKYALEDVAAETPATLKQANDLLNVAYAARLALYKAYENEDPVAAAQYAKEAFQARPDLDEGYQAIKQVLEAAGSSPKDLEDVALAHVAGILLRGNLDGALAACDSELAAAPSADWGERLSLLRARLLERKGSYLEAVKAYEDLRAKWSDKRASLELAALYRKLGRSGEAQAIYEKQLQDSPGAVDAVIPLMSLLVNSGQMDQARSLAQKVEDQLGPTAAQALLLGLSLREGQMDQAIALARSLVEMNPQKPLLHVLLAELLWRHGDLDGSRKAFDDALALNAKFLPAYRRALLDLEDDKPDQAVDLMRKGVEQLPDEPSLAAQLAVAQQAGGDPEGAAAVLQNALAPKALPPAARQGLQWYLAVLYAGLGDGTKATVANQDVSASEIGPRDLRQHLLEQIGSLAPPQRQKAAAALNLLVLFSRGERLEATVQQVRTLHDLLPDEPLPMCLEAQLLDKQDKHEEAVGTYKALIAEHPEFLYARLRLIDSYLGAEDTTAAVQALQDMLGQVAPTQAGWLHLELGRIYENQGQVDAAITNYREAMANPQARAIAANNVAWLLATARNDLAGALPLAQQAAQEAPNNPAIIDTLGWIYCLSGDPQKAVASLQMAKAAAATNPTIRYHLGMAYLKAGRRDDARAELREALTISKDFPEAAEATNALKGL